MVTTRKRANTSQENINSPKKMNTSQENINSPKIMNTSQENTISPKKVDIGTTRPLLHGNSSCSNNVDFSDASCDASDPSTQINNVIIDYRKEWPFKKSSSVWATIESLDVFKNRPQKPHFGELENVDECFREGDAMGLMLTFANVVENSLEIPVDDPNDIINKCLKALVKLEAEYGFDVDFVRGRLNDLFRKKNALVQLKEDSEVVKKKLDKLIDTTPEPSGLSLASKAKSIDSSLAQPVAGRPKRNRVCPARYPD